MSHESISYARQIANELNTGVVNNYITQEPISQMTSIDIASTLEQHDVKLEKKSCQLNSKLEILSQKIEQLIISQSDMPKQVNQELLNMRLVIHDQQLITISKRLSDMTSRLDQLVTDMTSRLDQLAGEQSVLNQATLDTVKALVTSEQSVLNQDTLNQLASSQDTLNQLASSQDTLNQLASSQDTLNQLASSQDTLNQLAINMTSRIDQLDSDVTSRIDQLDSDVTSRIDQLDSDVTSRIDQLDSDVTSRIDQLNSNQVLADMVTMDQALALNQATLEQLASDKALILDTVKALVDAVEITDDSVIINKQLCLSDGNMCGALYKKPDDYALYWNTDIFETPVTTLQKYPFKSLVRPNDCVCLSDGYVEKITYGTWSTDIVTEQLAYIVSNTLGVITISNDTYTCVLPNTYTNHWLIYDNSVGIVILLLVSNCVEILLLSSDLQVGYRSTIDIVTSNRSCLCLLPGQVVVIAHGCYKFFILLPSDYNRAFSISEIYIDNNCINCIDMQYDVINELVVSIDETITNNCCQLFDIVGMQLRPVFLKRLNINTGYKLCTNDYNYLLYYADGVVIFKIIDSIIDLQTICLGHGVFKVGKALPSEYIGIVQLVNNNYAYVCIKGSICYMETTADQIGKKIYFGPNCSYSTCAINSNYLIGTCINNGKLLVGL